MVYKRSTLISQNISMLGGPQKLITKSKYSINREYNTPRARTQLLLISPLKSHNLQCSKVKD